MSPGRKGVLAAGLVLAVSALAAGAGVATAFLGWPIALAEELRPQVGLVALAAAGLLAPVGRPRLALLLLVVALPLLAPWAVRAVERRPAVAEAQGSFEVVSFNVRAGNRELGRLARWLNRERADVVFLHEVGRRGLEILLGAVEDPRRVTTVSRARDLPFGSLVVTPAGWPVERVVLGPEGYPALVVTVRRQGRVASVLGTHAPSPKSRGRWSARNAQLAELATWARRRGGDLAVVGDLNATPASGPFRSLLRAGGLVDSLRGRAWQPSWPAALGPLGVEIDHAAHTAGLVTLDRSVGDSLGSDHRLLRVTFGFLPDVPPRM